jgi:Family of unknown function (DUF6600)
MNRLSKLLMISMVGGAMLAGSQAWAQFEMGASAQIGAGGTFGINSVADFYSPLAPYGMWLSVGSFGRCWHPTNVGPGWRPYCDGQWIWTDAGWYFQSDEPWGWACAHYGNWFVDPSVGWVWMPGTEWAPAWVNWREGDGYIGWAPTPPPGIALPSYAPQYAFVPANRFQDPIQPQTVLFNDRTILDRTRPLTTIRHETREIAGARHRIAVNEGPGMALVEKATHQRVKAVPIEEAVRHAAVPARRTAPQHKELRNAPQIQQPNAPQHELRNPAPGTQPGAAPIVTPRQEMTPRENQPPTARPAPSEHRNLLPGGTTPREMQPIEPTPPPQRGQARPEPGLNPQVPARRAPLTAPKFAPNEAQRGAPQAAPGHMYPAPAPAQSERPAPAQPQPPRREEPGH